MIPTTLHILFTLVVVLGNQPAPHARIQCAEIVRHTDTVPSSEDTDGTEQHTDPLDGPGAVLITDSRGRMIYGVPLDFILHCRAWAVETPDIVWEGTLRVTHDKQRIAIHLDTGIQREEQ